MIDLTGSWIGLLAVAIFGVGYALVVSEEFTHLRKSKAMMLGAGLIWGLIAFGYVRAGEPHLVEVAVMEFLGEFAAQAFDLQHVLNRFDTTLSNRVMLRGRGLRP